MRVFRDRVEEALDRRLPPTTHPPARLHEAMRYACLEGGKRMRAMLVYACGELAGAPLSVLDVPACAVELIHAYSLVHDDLPAMDDDQLRRGRPTCHIAFDEAIAILAGDALQALAFGVLADDPALKVAPERRLRMIGHLARAAGSRGLVGGQVKDLAAVGRRLSLDELKDVHCGKTAALIRAAVALGALAGDRVDGTALAALDEYARNVGLAFQIIDDVLDESADTAVLGKTSGADKARNKPTYAAVLGVAPARVLAEELYHNALESVRVFGDNAQTLEHLARLVVKRTY